MASLNERIRQRQTLLFGGLAGGGGLLIVLWLIFSGGGSSEDRAEQLRRSLQVSTIVNPPKLEEEWLTQATDRLNALERQMTDVEALKAENEELRETLGARDAQIQEITEDAKRIIDVYGERIDTLEAGDKRRRRSHLATEPREPGVTGSTFPPAPASGQNRSLPNGLPDAVAATPQRKIEVLRFDDDVPNEDDPDVYDVESYLPPNSYAPAKVLMGVDASTAVTAQSDPLPVLFRITGPAVSVLSGGRPLKTDLTGCLVNGSATGDLSSEKVLIKLHVLTCEHDGRKVAVADVQGVVAYGNKAGVRGRVVSREGDLITKAFLAGIAGGAGRGLSANVDQTFRQVGIGENDPLTAGQIASGSFGQGLATASDRLSDYLIDRAEQYQPIIEMPAGVDVTLVFINGARIRKDR
ncbi:MAG: TrbI/VirB10 family protein [Pseudomonadota bacterium]